MSYPNLADMFFRRARDFADRPRYLAKRNERWQEVSWREHERAVLEIAAGLARFGVEPDTRVALLCETRPEWLEVDFGILATGGVSVPIYPSLLPSECGYILWNSESRFCVVENDAQARKIRELLEKGFEIDGQPHPVELERVFLIDGEGDGERFLSLAELRARGREFFEEGGRNEIERRVASRKRDDLATIVYTSGTTGPPKGVLQTHGNHLATMEAIADIGAMGEGEMDFLFLPLAHSFARSEEYFSTYIGTVTAFAESIPKVPENIRETRPHFIPSVPRIFEKIYARILSTRDQGNVLTKAIFDWAVSVGRERSRYVQKRMPVPFRVDAQFRIADALVFGKLREQLGGRLKYMISGGAPLAREIQEFFHAAGLLILEGYGLTETTPTLTVNRPNHYKFGTVGQAVKGVTLKIAPDGEILAKGPNITQGYYKRPDANEEAFDAEGWFHTGDIGEIDEDGFLRITDRKKDLIKTSGGKYVAPQNIENLLKMQPHVSQAVVIGDNRKYCVALITLDPEELQRWAEERGTPGSPEELARHPEVEKLIDQEVQAANRHLASYESIKYFRILPHDFTQEDGELTPSLKVKRKVVSRKYADLIDEMYA